MLLKFIDFLYKYLKEGSFVLVYSGMFIIGNSINFILFYQDTDSVTLATTETGPITGTTRLEEMEQVFLPIVKPELLSEFKSVWGNWLVLSNRIEDEKRPGLLKVEFSTRNGEMVCLSPKSYYALCRDQNKSKDGRKGIPSWFDLDLDSFRNVLYRRTNEKSVAQVRSLRLDKDKKMSRTTMHKSGLTGIHCKLGVADDGITCEPLCVNNVYI